MRRMLSMVGVLLAVMSTPAFPSGIELAWNHCFGQAGAVGIRTSACDVNSGNQSLIASFRPPAGPNVYVGVEVYVDFQVSGGVLPCWWNFQPGQIRQNQLLFLPVSPTDGGGTPLVTCDNHYFLANGGVGGGAMIVTGVDTGQLRGVAAIPLGAEGPIPAEAQQYGFGFRIGNGSTVPAATCPGCTQSACMILNLIKLVSPDQPDVILNSAHFGSQNFVAWQSVSPGGPCAPTPVAPSTWGGIKSIYR